MIKGNFGDASYKEQSMARALYRYHNYITAPLLEWKFNYEKARGGQVDAEYI